MFFVQVYKDGEWKRISGKDHSSVNYAKSELKKMYDSCEIELPVSGFARVVGPNHSISALYLGRNKGLRFCWENYYKKSHPS